MKIKTTLMKKLYSLFPFILVAIMVIGCLFGCNQQSKILKAKHTLEKAGALAEICADEFPVKTEYIKGDSVLLLDTLYVGIEYSDTEYITKKDTVEKIITKTLPEKVITKTIRITDTLIQENTARVKALESKLAAQEKKTEAAQAAADKYKTKAKKYFWIIIFLAGAGALYVFLKVKKILPL